MDGLTSEIAHSSPLTKCTLPGNSNDNRLAMSRKPAGEIRLRETASLRNGLRDLDNMFSRKMPVFNSTELQTF